MTELLKCPFCGGEAKFANNDGNWIVCNVCDAESAYFESRYETIEAWNTRKPVQDVLERLEVLVEKYMNNSEKAAELGKERHMILNGAKGMAFEAAIEIVKEGLK